MQQGQFRAGINAEFLDQVLRGPLVGRQRLTLAAAPVQGQHELGPEPLPHRVGRSQVGQLRDQLARSAESKEGLDAPLDRLKPLSLELR